MEYLTTFLILARDEPYESVEKTLLSVKSFIDKYFYTSPGNAQVLCMCGEGMNPCVQRLKQYDSDRIKIISPEDFNNIISDEIPGIGPEIFILSNNGLRISTGEVIIVLQPGMAIKTESYSQLSTLIKAVGDKDDMIVISRDAISVDQPHSIIFSQHMMMMRCYLKTAISGFDVTCKKSLFGDLKYDRVGPYPIGAIFNVPWLIRSIAYDSQHDKMSQHIGKTKIAYDQWV